MKGIMPKRRNPARPGLWWAAMLLAAVAVMSLAELNARGSSRTAQATGTPGQPLQATPAPAQSTTPAESKPGGTRPTTPAPEPARPDAEARKEGARPALPAAPAEKMAPPIPEKK